MTSEPTPRPEASAASPGGPRFGPGREFEMIRSFLDGAGALPPEVRVGPGDDAAVLEGGWVVSTDLSVEDVHFRRAWLDDTEIGFRAAAAALSDLAAMAAAPVAVLPSVAVPVDSALDLAALQAGIRAAAESVGAGVVGGDLSRTSGPLVVDVTVLGRAAWPVLRSGAEPGDEVWVTGRLGGAAAAVALLTAGRDVPDDLRRAFAAPNPRVREACCLAEHEIVDAMIDLSDGLVGDLGHVAAASGVAIVVDVDAVPTSDAAVEALGAAEGLDAALFGGEDYELAFVTDPDVVDVAYFSEQHGFACTRVARVEEGTGVWLEGGGSDRRRPDRTGHDHWRGDAG